MAPSRTLEYYPIRSRIACITITAAPRHSAAAAWVQGNRGARSRQAVVASRCPRGGNAWARTDGRAGGVPRAPARAFTRQLPRDGRVRGRRQSGAVQSWAAPGSSLLAGFCAATRRCSATRSHTATSCTRCGLKLHGDATSEAKLQVPKTKKFSVL